MDGIVIGIDPVLLHLGHLSIRWFGIFFVLAIFAGAWLALREEAKVLSLAGLAFALAAMAYVFALRRQGLRPAGAAAA